MLLWIAFGTTLLQYVVNESKKLYHEFKLPVVKRSSTLSSVCHHCELDSLTLVLEGATYTETDHLNTTLQCSLDK